MEKIHYLLTKAGPRLLDLMVDTAQIDILITAPGMLFQRLELVTNLGLLEGCDAGFYHELAKDLEATVFCSHQAPLSVDIAVDAHRIGAELTIGLGESSMYQSLLRLRTHSGKTFKEVITASRAMLTDHAMMAGFYVVRATGNHEHHKSSRKHIRAHADMNHADMQHTSHK
jgi:hypothetical protein